MLNAFFILTLVLFIIVCLFLILLILIQKGRGGGLSSAFGGGGGNTAFGSKTGDVLTWATSVVFGIFLVLAIILNRLANAVAAPTNPNTAPLVVGGQEPAPAMLPNDPTLPPTTQSSPSTAQTLSEMQNTLNSATMPAAAGGMMSNPPATAPVSVPATIPAMAPTTLPQ